MAKQLLIKTNNPHWIADSKFRIKWGGVTTRKPIKFSFRRAFRTQDYAVAVGSAACLCLIGANALFALATIGGALYCLDRRWVSISCAELETAEPINESSDTSFLAKLGWGLAGGFVFGGVGLLAGVLGKGNSKTGAALLQFAGERKALITADLKTIQAIVLHAQKL